MRQSERSERAVGSNTQKPCLLIRPSGKPGATWERGGSGNAPAERRDASAGGVADSPDAPQRAAHAPANPFPLRNGRVKRARVRSSKTPNMMPSINSNETCLSVAYDEVFSTEKSHRFMCQASAGEGQGPIRRPSSGLSNRLADSF